QASGDEFPRASHPRATATLLPVARTRRGAGQRGSIMKRGGILHPALSHLLASTGHTDYFTISDRGFPVPVGPERIDLALTDGIPTVLDVIRAVAAEWHLDRVVIAEEMTEVSPQRVEEL